ncbi:MAG: hypothetical protein JW840_01465, partial [Candidatus Thermoplasmatota archaeon]|nr:hypothetical protein [Candidatus Thermoplasmatota archaeon]
MNKVLLCIGLLLLLIGSGVIVQQKLHEPYYREDLFTETSPALVYRDEPVLKTIHLPRQKNVYVYIETYGSLPITFSVHTLTDYEHNRSHPLVNASTTTGSFSGS